MAHEYNDLVRVLKDRIYTYGRLSFLQPFEMHSEPSATTIDMQQLRKALEDMNLKPSDATLQSLMEAISAHEGTNAGAIDYKHLADVLSWDQVPFQTLPHKLARQKTGPDTAAPFGETAMSGDTPWGITQDAVDNVRGMKETVARRFSTLHSAFRRADSDRSGRLSKSQFVKAMRELDRVSGTKLTESEVANLFEEGEPDEDGCVDYQRFLVRQNALTSPAGLLLDKCTSHVLGQGKNGDVHVSRW